MRSYAQKQFSIWLSVIILIAFSIMMFPSCKTTENKVDLKSLSEYERSHTIWINQRIKALTAPEGWLSVVGLHWLKQGSTNIGSRESMDIVMEDIAKNMGFINAKEDGLYFQAGGESYMTVDGIRFTQGPIESDENGTPTKLSHKSYIFYVIKRGDRYALRVKNTLARKRYQLKEIPAFPVNYDLILNADVKNVSGTKSMAVEDITGHVEDYKIVAELIFKIGGKKYKLPAFDGGQDFYFVIFGDQTNGTESYGGGRYMYIPKETQAEGKIIIDFNKAFNPPCVFTDYATCPIPPKENILEVRIDAGEKYPVVYR
jgi:uncharacterized protein (DUF1684 family)